MPGCVKIGKTTRDSTARAAELSTATGVPTPFLVVYEAYFADCDHAETYIHSLLETSGVRLASNREFFTVSAPQAINVVIQALNDIGSDSQSSIVEDEVFFQDELLLDIGSIDEHKKKPWEDVLDDAYSYLYGLDDELEDTAKAIKLFKLAAKLGSADAYIQLGQLYEDTKGLEWLKRGANKGLTECWIMLAEVLSGNERSYYGTIPINKENAIKCFRRVFEIDDLSSFDPEGSKVYFYLGRYLSLLDGRSSERDIAVVNCFIFKFRSMLLAIPHESESKAKLNELSDLLKKHHFVGLE